MSCCPKCGNQLTNESTFCTTCGEPVQNVHTYDVQSSGVEAINKKKRKPRGVLGFVIGVLLSAVVFRTLGLNKVNNNKADDINTTYVEAEDDSNSQKPKFAISEGSDDIYKIEGEGFSTPEEAVIAYLEAFRAGDVDKMLATFAVETYVENFDFNYMLENTGSYNFSNEEQVVPTSNEFTKEINCFRRSSLLTQEMFMQYLYVTNFENNCQAYKEVIPIMSEKIYSDEENEWLERFNSPKASSVLNSIQICNFLSAEELKERFYFTSFARNYDAILTHGNASKKQSRYRMDEIEELCIEISVDNKRYMVCMELYRYGKKWYNGNFGGDIYTCMRHGEQCEHVGIVEYTEPAPEEADKELLGDVYASCMFMLYDPDILSSEKPEYGQFIDMNEMKNTDWGKSVLELLYVSDFSEVEAKLRSSESGEGISIYLDENGNFIIESGSLKYPDD